MPQVKAKSGKTSEAKKELEAMLASARKFGYRSYEYEARLVLAEIELQSHSAAARPHLAALEKDAKEHGLLLIANHAQAVAQAQVLVTGVAVEKVAFLKKLSKFGDRKCPGDSRESFIAHPDAILFSRFSREGVFQQPQAFALTILREQAGSTRPRL
jgi:hypothetical protein